MQCLDKLSAAQPLSLFTAPRVDYSLQRLRHYTGTAPEHFQNFVLFTNYQFYIDEFVRLGRAAIAKSGSEYHAFVAPEKLPQMPAYHLMRPDRSGISMVNIGIGPANAKTITDHIAVRQHVVAERLRVARTSAVAQHDSGVRAQRLATDQRALKK